MRRTRLEGTSYGEVSPVTDDVGKFPVTLSSDGAEVREDRWAIRRGALSRQLVLDARDLFARRLQRPVSENEARNLLGNLADYVWMLVQWEVSGPDPVASPKEKNLTQRPRGRPRKSDNKKRKPPVRPPSA